MLVEGLLFIAVGVVGLLLPLSAGYRARLVDRLGDQARLEVPGRYREAFEMRETRRMRAGGVGIILTGLVIIGLSLAGVERGTLDGWVLFSLMVVLGTMCLAAVEIWWPSAPVDGPRAARMTSPGLGDYLPPLVRRGYAVLVAVGFALTAGALLLGLSGWFDQGTLWRSPLPLVLVALPVLTGLTWVAVRRILDAPQPARDETELYWQDVIRSSTLASLLVPTAVVALLGVLAVGLALDYAASVAAAEIGVGPSWTAALLVAGYVLPIALVAVLLVLTAGRFGGTEVAHMRDRLWGGQVPADRAQVGNRHEDRS